MFDFLPKVKRLTVIDHGAPFLKIRARFLQTGPFLFVLPLQFIDGCGILI